MNSPIEHDVLLIGRGEQALEWARRLACSLPLPTEEQFAELVAMCEESGIRGPLFPDPKEVPFRAPHFSAHPIGIFGGGDTPFAGDLALTKSGVLFLRDIEHFAPEIVVGIAECLRTQSPTERGRIVIHTDAAVTLPDAINDLHLPSIILD